MQNLKKLATAFVVGFLLSFFAGLFGGVSFAVVLLRAGLSGLVVAVLTFAAFTVYNTFLTPEDSVETSKDVSTQEEETTHTVDITLDDELPDSATAPAFNLSNYVQPLDDDNEQEGGDFEKQGGFQTTSLDAMTGNVNTTDVKSVETPSDVEGTSYSPSQKAKTVNSDYEQDILDDESGADLDVLPDIESLEVDDTDGSAADSGEIIEDSVFAETGDVRPTAPAAPVSEMGDAKDIAAAIRTALVKDT